MGQVEGKVAIVTGGASGIGAACAATLAREGAKVVITDIDDAGAQAVVGKIVAAGGEAICLHQDVSIEEEWPRVIEATERRFGQLNVMMANAGSNTHFERLRAELERLGTAGNLATDAHLAVLAMERGYILYSTDMEFARFSGLRWVNPCKEARGS